MRVGDLVKYKTACIADLDVVSKQWTGLIIAETCGHLKILWNMGVMSEETKGVLEVVSESR